MSNDKRDLSDVFGVKPLSETVHVVAKGAVEGAAAFLSRICLPAAEEFGLLLKDKVSAWRAKNAIAVIQKAEKLFAERKIPEGSHAHPRLVSAAVEHGSWSDSDVVQDLWAGLLTSSCSPDGGDESNVIFVGLLAQINRSEALLFKRICESAEKEKSLGGWIGPKGHMNLTIQELMAISGIDDIHRIDLELDHLRALDLIDGGFDPTSTTADVMPSPLGLQMYVRRQGYIGSPLDYFGLS